MLASSSEQVHPIERSVQLAFPHLATLMTSSVAAVMQSVATNISALGQAYERLEGTISKEALATRRVIRAVADG